MNTEKTKDSLVKLRPLNGDFSEPTPSTVLLGTTTLQNPRAPGGFCRGTDGPTRPLPIHPRPFPGPKFPCPTRLHSRTAAFRPPRWASAVRAWGISPGSFPLCVLSDLGGVPRRAPTIGALPENTPEIGKNAEREKGGSARAAYSLRRSSEFYTTPLPPHARRRGPVTLRSGCGSAALCTSRLCGPADSARLNSYGLARNTPDRPRQPFVAYATKGCQAPGWRGFWSLGIRSGRRRRGRKWSVRSCRRRSRLGVRTVSRRPDPLVAGHPMNSRAGRPRSGRRVTSARSAAPAAGS